MAKFTDRLGQEWTVDVTVGSVARVRRLTGEDLWKCTADGMRLLSELTEDPARRVAVLYALCEPQIRQRGLSEEQFADVFAGDSIEAAWTAFLDSLTDCLPDAKSRDALRRFLRMVRELRESALATLCQTANAALDEVDRLVAAAP